MVTSLLVSGWLILSNPPRPSCTRSSKTLVVSICSCNDSEVCDAAICLAYVVRLASLQDGRFTGLQSSSTVLFEFVTDLHTRTDTFYLSSVTHTIHQCRLLHALYAKQQGAIADMYDRHQSMHCIPVFVTMSCLVVNLTPTLATVEVLSGLQQPCLQKGHHAEQPDEITI